MEIVKDVCKLLQDNSLGVIGSSIFGYQWGKADQQILVLNGVSNTSDLKDLYEELSVQILVRGDKNKPASSVHNLAQSIYRLLVAQPETLTINGNVYKGFDPSSNVAPLGKDENNRFVFSLNFETIRGI